MSCSSVASLADAQEFVVRGSHAVCVLGARRLFTLFLFPFDGWYQPPSTIKRYGDAPGVF